MKKNTQLENVPQYVCEVPESERGLSFSIFKCDVPDDVELQFDDPRLTKDNSLYLTIQQEYFDQIVAGTKVIEYRELKPTTFKKYLVCDELGPVPYREDIKWPKGITNSQALHWFNGGDFPFTPLNINFLKFKAGATAHDMDSAVVEVMYITVSGENRYDITKDGKIVPNQGTGLYCDWIIEFHLGKVRGLHRKGRK